MSTKGKIGMAAIGAMADGVKKFKPRPGELSGTDINGLIWEIRQRARGEVMDAALASGRYTEDRAGNLLDRFGNVVEWNGPSGLGRAELDLTDDLYNNELRPRLENQWGEDDILNKFTEDIDVAESAALTFKELEDLGAPREITGPLFKQVGPGPRDNFDLDDLGVSQFIYDYEMASPAERKMVKKLLKNDESNYAYADSPLSTTLPVRIVQEAMNLVSLSPAQRQKFMALPREERIELLNEPERFITQIMGEKLDDTDIEILFGSEKFPHGLMDTWDRSIADALAAARTL